MSEQLWQFDGTRAQLQSKRCVAVVEPSAPARGIHDLAIDGAALPGARLMALDAPCTQAAQLAETYVRANDLVATYPEQSDQALTAQLYWRAKLRTSAPSVAAIELIAAVHTSLLDLQPRFATQTEILASEAFQMVDPVRGTFASVVPKPDHSEVHDELGLPRCYLFRLPGGRYSYAEMVHPADSQPSIWEGWLAGPDFRIQLFHPLFATRLEKGVILKAQVQGILLDRHSDRAAAAAHYAAFVAEEPPLTA